MILNQIVNMAPGCQFHKTTLVCTLLFEMHKSYFFQMAHHLRDIYYLKAIGQRVVQDLNNTNET